MKPSIVEHTQSKFVLIDKSSLYGILTSAENLQEVIDLLDNALIPVSKFNDGLSTKEDKAIIDYLAVNASDKIYVYSNQEQANVNPTTRIIVADNEGLTIQYPTSDTARIGMSPHYNSVTTQDGATIHSINGNKSIEFINSSTADVLITDGKLQIDATKTKEFALAMSLVFGG